MMNIVFFYPGEILPERGGVQRVTHVLANYFSERGHTVYYLSVGISSIGKEMSSRQYFIPEYSNIDESIQFYVKFLIKKNIDIVINQAGTLPAFSNIVYSANTLKVKVISVIHNSILAGIINFDSLYKNIASKYGVEWLLPITKGRVINNILKFLYKLKYKGTL